MKRATAGLIPILGLAALAGLSTTVKAALKPGEPAPAFTVEAAKGGRTFTFDLAATLRQGPVVVYFYPKSFTSVCTAEAHDFADAIPAFEAAGARVIGLSGDTIATQRDFSSMACRDTFPVGADSDLAIARAYDVAMAIPGTGIGFANRISYVIAPDGTILSTLADGDAAPHIANALAAVRAWRAGHRS